MLNEWHTSVSGKEGFRQLSLRVQEPWVRSKGIGRASHPQGKSRWEDQRREPLTQTPILFTCMEGHVFL